MLFSPYYLSLFPEPAEVAEMYAHERRLLEQYKKAGGVVPTRELQRSAMLIV